LVNICLTDGGGVSVDVGVMTVVVVAVDIEDCEDWNDVDAVTSELLSIFISITDLEPVSVFVSVSVSTLISTSISASASVGAIMTIVRIAAALICKSSLLDDSICQERQLSMPMSVSAVSNNNNALSVTSSVCKTSLSMQFQC